MADERPLPPLVGWAVEPAAPAPGAGGWPTSFSFGGILSDALARYGADPVRIFLVGLIPAVLAIATSTQSTSALLVTLLSLISTSITLVLADRGPRSSLRRAIGLGLRRTGWLLLTAIVFGIIVGFTALIPAVIVISAIGSNIGLAVVLGFIGAVPVLWVAMRLVLASPAVVIDDVSTNVGFDRARTATRGRSAPFVLFAILFLADLAVFPASLGAGALSVVIGVPFIVVIVVAGVLVAIVTPIGTLAQLSAYRRAFPPDPEPATRAPKIAPMRSEAVQAAAAAASAAAAAAATATASDAREIAADPASLQTTVPSEIPAAVDIPADATPAAVPGWLPIPVLPAAPAPASVAVPAPPFGRAARTIAGLTIAIAVLGVGSFGYAIIAAAAGGASVAGNVPRGTVVFGRAVNLTSCVVTSPFTVLPTGAHLGWVAALAHRTRPTDRVRLVINFNGTKAVDQPEQSGVFDCLGLDEGVPKLDPGSYEIVVYINDAVSSRGTLTVP